MALSLPILTRSGKATRKIRPRPWVHSRDVSYAFCNKGRKSQIKNGSPEPFLSYGVRRCQSGTFSRRSAFVNDVRTRYEARDPALLKLIEKVRKVKRLVEAGAKDPDQCEGCARPKEPMPPVKPLVIGEPRSPGPKKKTYRSSLYFRRQRPDLYSTDRAYQS